MQSFKRTRLKRQVNLAQASALFGQDRETIEEAHPGDVIGLNNPGTSRHNTPQHVPTRPNTSSSRVVSCRVVCMYMCARVNGKEPRRVLPSSNQGSPHVQPSHRP